MAVSPENLWVWYCPPYPDAPASPAAAAQKYAAISNKEIKDTISDISHQLKTPLAALNIYNGLLQDEDIDVSCVKEFADLSERELDRMETLVQNLLKIAKLDAGAIVFEKEKENVETVEFP